MVTVVQGKVCAKNHPDRLSRLATIHQRYRRTDGQTDGQTDFLWHRPRPNGRPKNELKINREALHREALQVQSSPVPWSWRQSRVEVLTWEGFAEKVRFYWWRWSGIKAVRTNNGVLLVQSRAFGLAWYDNSSLTSVVLPLLAARCSGVLPCRSDTFTTAPFNNSISATCRQQPR